jgi:hypothetical protein
MRFERITVRPCTSPPRFRSAWFRCSIPLEIPRPVRAVGWTADYFFRTFRTNLIAGRF